MLFVSRCEVRRRGRPGCVRGRQGADHDITCARGVTEAKRASCTAVASRGFLPSKNENKSVLCGANATFKRKAGRERQGEGGRRKITIRGSEASLVVAPPV